jgi:hypothetical protein
MTIRGSMTPGAGAPEVDSIRLALAWYPGFVREDRPIDGPGDCFAAQPTGIVAQELAYEPIFPIEFRFDITAPPPVEAQVHPDEPGWDGVAAVGSLVAYQDLNGNGRLDGCPLEGPCPDLVLGASTSWGGGAGEQVMIIYVDRPYSDESVSFEPGLNLVQFIEGEPNPVVLPRDASIHIELTDVREVQQMACEAVCANGTGAGGPAACPPDAPDCMVVVPPVPEGATLECDPDGRQYQWQRTECPSVCSCTSETFAQYLAPDDAVPAGWPCPIESP